MIPIAEYILLIRTFWDCQSYRKVFSFPITMPYGNLVEIANDQAKYFIMLVGLEFVVETALQEENQLQKCHCNLKHLEWIYNRKAESA